MPRGDGTGPPAGRGRGHRLQHRQEDAGRQPHSDGPGVSRQRRAGGDDRLRGHRLREGGSTAARGRPRVGRYGVDVGAIERVGVAALRRALAAGQIVVVDEIGKMELFSGPFKQVVLEAVNGPHVVVATVMARPNPWVDALKAMPGVTLWEVTYATRDGLPERVVGWVDR